MLSANPFLAIPVSTFVLAGECINVGAVISCAIRAVLLDPGARDAMSVRSCK
jgi:hypothetical protein